jgi:putative hydrolase of HD superfamily
MGGVGHGAAPCVSSSANAADIARPVECLLQAVEYREQGCSNVQPWIDSSIASLKTASAQSLADAALTMSSIAWQQTYLR